MRAGRHRWYDWALVATSQPEACLLIRRSTTRPSELAFYLCPTPRQVPLAVLVKVAGTRWSVEECFQAGTNEAGISKGAPPPAGDSDDRQVAVRGPGLP